MFCKPRDEIFSRGVNHHEVQGLLAAYAAGTLAEAEAERVRAHLASGCLECLADVFARPVGLPRDLPMTYAVSPQPGSSWRAFVGGLALLTGVAGAALLLGRGDAGSNRRPDDTAGAARVAPPPPASTLPARSEPPITPPDDDVTAERAEARTPASTAPSPEPTTQPSPPVTAPPPEASPTIPETAAKDAERARLLAQLAAEREQLDLRTRELEAAAARARAAEAESAEQATALAALDAQLAAAKRRADDLDHRLRAVRPPAVQSPATSERTAVESVLAAPEPRLLALRAVGRFRDVRGHAVWHPGSDAVVVYGFGLPHLPNGRTYNVRVDVGSGEAIIVPRIRPDARGRVVVPVRLPSSAHAVTGVRIARDTSGDAVLAGDAPASTR
jgi:hypothetical protein